MRTNGERFNGRADKLGRLKALCWCGRNYIWVPAGQLMNGDTGSCSAACKRDFEENGLRPPRGGRKRGTPKSWALRGSGT